MSRPALEFWRSWEAFPHTRNEDDHIMVSVHPDRPEFYEFQFTDVGSARRRSIAVQVSVFSDSWRAFTELPEVFGWLATRQQDETTLDDVAAMLLSLGAVDVTSRYAGRHEHTFACSSCGQVADR